MSHVNPIKSRPLSAQGRESYDRIFRKKPFEAVVDEWQQLQDYYAANPIVPTSPSDENEIPTELNHHI